TGLPRTGLDGLAASLELPYAAAREQRLHLDRRHPRRAATGKKGPDWLSLRTQLLAAICHHRLAMPSTHIAALLGADPSTISEATRRITTLLTPGHPAIAPGPPVSAPPATCATTPPPSASPSQTPHQCADAGTPSTTPAATRPQLDLFWNTYLAGFVPTSPGSARQVGSRPEHH
ncbi:MAG: hypothetical protein WAK82_29210, partial [Streptosporangiaceae bacterium]